MNENHYPDNPYLLLTPGPLSTSKTVKATMLRDWCTWDADYNMIVQNIRKEIVGLATINVNEYTSVLMQGSGTFSVESLIGSAIPPEGKLLVLVNGTYGKRIAEIAHCLNISYTIIDSGELAPPSLRKLEETLSTDYSITHVAVVHCETTTGMLNPILEIGQIVKTHQKIFIVDAMSSFGGIPMDIDDWKIDFLISSANKCIQGVPGFGFIIAKRALLENIKGFARSLSLDLYSQWETMEEENGKWRFTSPTHVVRAFQQALIELKQEGGIEKRYLRYFNNQKKLVEGMKELGFKALLDEKDQSPFITTFISPNDSDFEFEQFYNMLKEQGFVIYPGKVTDYPCFRIGTIGEVYPADINGLLNAVKVSMYWEGEKKNKSNLDYYPELNGLR